MTAARGTMIRHQRLLNLFLEIRTKLITQQSKVQLEKLGDSLLAAGKVKGCRNPGNTVFPSIKMPHPLFRLSTEHLIWNLLQSTISLSLSPLPFSCSLNGSFWLVHLALVVFSSHSGRPHREGFLHLLVMGQTVTLAEGLDFCTTVQTSATRPTAAHQPKLRILPQGR